MNTILFIQPIICDTFLRKFLNLLFFVAFVDGLFNYSNHSFCCLFPFCSITAQSMSPRIGFGGR